MIMESILQLVGWKEKDWPSATDIVVTASSSSRVTLRDMHKEAE